MSRSFVEVNRRALSPRGYPEGIASHSPAAVFDFKGDLEGMCGIPGSFGFEHGVEDHQEFSHAGHDDFFGSFFVFGVGTQSESEGFDDGVVSHGRLGGHVQDVADGGSAAGDAALALVVSAVVVEGSDSDQGCDLGAIEFTEFRQFGQHRRRGLAGDSGDGLQDLGLGSPVVVGLDEPRDFGFEVFDLVVEHLEQFADALLGDFVDGLLQTIGLHRAQFDELPTTDDEFRQLGLLGRKERRPTWFRLLSEARDDGGVEAIGLGQDPQALGEIADTLGIDDRDPIPGVEQGTRHGAFVSPGGFQHDGGLLRWRQRLEQLGKPRLVVGHLLDLQRRLGGRTDIQRILGNIQTYPHIDRIGIHERIPSLRIRARVTKGTALAAVRAEVQKPTAIPLGSGVRRTKGCTIYGRSLWDVRLDSRRARRLSSLTSHNDRP